MKAVFIVFVAAVSVLPYAKGTTILQSTQTDGFWGDWGLIETCPSGQFVYGYRLLSEPRQGSDDDEDDTALNAIELLCSQPHRAHYSTISSNQGEWGSWSSYKYCSGSNNPVIGFDMKIEGRQGDDDDDTAANDVDLSCKKSGQISADVETHWGTWTSVLLCPEGEAVMGISTRVEGSLGRDGDDTALNGVRMICDRYKPVIPLPL